jgi:hypothetical protein
MKNGSCTETLKKLAANIFHGAIIFICLLLGLFLVAGISKSLNILDGLVNTVKNFVCLIKPLVPLFAAVFGASYFAKGLTDKEDKESTRERIIDSRDKIGKQAPYLIGKGGDDHYYYIGQSRDFDFNKIAAYKTEIGTDWDFTPQWKPAIKQLIKSRNINADVDALPDYSGNGERHCRGMFFVFSTSREIPQGQSANL